MRRGQLGYPNISTDLALFRALQASAPQRFSVLRSSNVLAMEEIEFYPL